MRINEKEMEKILFTFAIDFDNCKCKFENDPGHHCKKGSFTCFRMRGDSDTCFRMRGDSDLTLDAPKNRQIIVVACPFCGQMQ